MRQQNKGRNKSRNGTDDDEEVILEGCNDMCCRFGFCQAPSRHCFGWIFCCGDDERMGNYLEFDDYLPHDPARLQCANTIGRVGPYVYFKELLLLKFGILLKLTFGIWDTGNDVFFLI